MRMRLLQLLVASVSSLSLLVLPPGQVAEAHNDGWAAPNGYSPWFYAESYQTTTWYGEGLHVDWDPQWGHINEHHALDFNMPCGKRLYPIWDGMTVSRVQGDIIEMTKMINGYKYRLRYRHLDSVIVRVGQTVGSTTVIGYSGNKGYSTGCHLHVVVHRLRSDGWYYSVPLTLCGHGFPHDHTTWWKGC